MHRFCIRGFGICILEYWKKMLCRLWNKLNLFLRIQFRMAFRFMFGRLEIYLIFIHKEITQFFLFHQFIRVIWLWRQGPKYCIRELYAQIIIGEKNFILIETQNFGCGKQMIIILTLIGFKSFSRFQESTETATNIFFIFEFINNNNNRMWILEIFHFNKMFMSSNQKWV